MRWKRNDLTGQRFGRLVVIEESPVRKRGAIHWVCKCDCGNITRPLRGDQLTTGNTRSCGCLHNEDFSRRNTTHGLHKTRLYGTYQGMKQRCFNPNDCNYKRYGARGITVCEEWRNDFKAFYDWAIANGYRDDLSIDRIDVNGNYEPSNCRWATMKEQANNKTQVKVRGKIRYPNLLSEIVSKNFTLRSISEKTGISPSTLSVKLHKGGFTFGEAVKIKRCIGTDILLEDLFREVE